MASQMSVILDSPPAARTGAAPPPRRRVLFGLYNETATKGVFDTATIGSLTARFDVDLISALPVDPGASFRGTVLHWSQNKARHLAWQTLYLSKLLPFTRKYYPERMADQNLWHGYAPSVLLTRPLVDTAVLRGPTARLMKAFLARTNPLDRLIGRDYDAILCITGVKDPMYDDLIRYGRAHGVPTIGVTQNWDNVNYKPMVERPDRLGVWGYQGYYVARLVHGLDHRDIVLAGAPRMDVYFGGLPDRDEARRRLGLPADKRLLLFAGAGPAFDETSLMEAIDGAIAAGTIRRDSLVLYKPHPRRAPRTAERPLDAARLRHVRVLPATGPQAIATADMPVLLRAVDAVISPYSTVLLEGALCGRPCLPIGYNDPAHDTINWTTARSFIHFAPFAFAPWAVCCEARAGFVPALVALDALIGRDDLARRAREDAGHVLFHDGRDFGRRIADAIEATIEERAATRRVTAGAAEAAR